ncbi:MAG: response regulator [Proteobacteria bacterium]|nr:MAG: response regulator [Pseudomonadota bacterium]
MTYIESQEHRRLNSLDSYAILDTLPEPVFDDITLLASQICQTPIALISFVDANRQWFKSRVGLQAEQTPRSLAFCNYTIEQHALFTVQDASADERFRENLLVTEDPNIRFYSGAVLKSASGEALGSLCVIDTKPRDLTAAQRSSLEALGRQVMQLLEYRKTQLEYQKAVRSLAAREQFLRLITDNIPAHIAYIGPDLRMKYANEYVCQTFNMTQEQLQDIPIEDLLTPEQFEQRKAAYLNALAGVPQAVKVEVIDSQGNLVITKNVITPDLDEKGRTRGIVVIAYDQTAEEKLKSDLLMASLDAEAANAAKSAFLANMSHEIRSPLGAMMGFVELMRDGDLSMPEQKEYLDIITRNAGQVTRVIDDILDLSKVEAGKIEVEEIEFSLADLLNDFAALTQFRARENGIEFVIRKHASVPNVLISDPTRLKQILSNVVGNAIKFTREGKVELDIAMSGDLLHFKVKDSGIGISRDNADQLFEAFHQADSSMTRKFGGTGLGLVLTRKLAQLMGGDFILAETELGIGSTFIASVLVKRPITFASHSAQVASPARVDRTALFANKFLTEIKILVVDDAPDNLLLMKTLLKRWGAVIETANDGAEGVSHATSGEFDLILMDVQMPKMSGHEAIRILRSLGYSRPVIALTAHAMADEREKCLASGYTDFLSKPIDRDELSTVLKRYLEPTVSLSERA